MEFEHVGVHKTGINRNCTNTRDYAQYALSVAAFSESAPPTPPMQSQPSAALQRGDLVRLRSGGPLMTVDSIKGDQVDCFWTGGDGEPNADNFPIDVLQKF